MKKSIQRILLMTLALITLFAFSAAGVYADEAEAEPLAGETPSENATFALRNGASVNDYSEMERAGVVWVMGIAGELQQTEAPEGMEGTDAYADKDGNVLFLYDSESGRYAYWMDYRDIHVDIDDALRQALQDDLDAGSYDDSFKAMAQDIITNYASVDLTFAKPNVLTVNVDGVGRVTYAYEDEELSYEDEDLFQSAQTPFIGTYRLDVVPEEGYEFVKWTLNGKDYSEEPQISITLDDEDLNLVAVFELIPEEDEEEPEAVDDEEDVEEPEEEDVPEVIDVEQEDPPIADATGAAEEEAEPEEVVEEAAKDESPATGDETNMLLAGILALLSGAVLACSMAARRRHSGR